MKQWAFLILCFLSVSAAAQGSASLPGVNVSVRAGETSPDIFDPSKVSFGAPFSGQYNRGYTSQDIWFRIELENTRDESLRALLVLDGPLVGRLHLKKEADPDFQVSGPGYLWSERAYPSRLGAFPLELGPREKSVYYLKRNSHHALSTQVLLQTPEQAKTEEAGVQLVYFFYLGGISCLILYNLFLGLFTGQRAHVTYAFFGAAFGSTALVIHGVFDSYLLRDGPLVLSNYLMFFSSLASLAATFFVRDFLSITKDFKVGYWGLRVFQGLLLVPLLASPFVPVFRGLFFLGYWIDITIVLLVLFMVYCGVYTYRKMQNRLAWYFLLSWGVVLMGAFVWLSSLHGILPANIVTRYSLLFANLGEMLVLSLGLAYKIRMLDAEKRRAERASEDKERFHRLVRVLSHDVANTLSGIAYHSGVLKEQCAGAPAELHVDRIAHSMNQLNSVLKSVRHEQVFYAFQEHGQMTEVPLREACEEALSHFSWQLELKNIQPVLRVPAEAAVRADRSALVNQVLGNLISNSIKFSHQGGLLKISYRESVSEFVLSLQDEGTGILPEEIPLLFKGKQLFSHRGTANESGSGLGTSLVGEYMRLFGGRVEVQSVHHSKGGASGTTVILKFPREH